MSSSNRLAVIFARVKQTVFMQKEDLVGDILSPTKSNSSQNGDRQAIDSLCSGSQNGTAALEENEMSKSFSRVIIA